MPVNGRKIDKADTMTGQHWTDCPVIRKSYRRAIFDFERFVLERDKMRKVETYGRVLQSPDRR